MSKETQKRFIDALNIIQTTLEPMGFNVTSPIYKGFATWISFKKPGIEIEFCCGPSEWHIEMIIRVESGTETKTYELANLMSIPSIGKWIRNTSQVVEDDDYLKDEARWYGELLKIALPNL